MKTPYPLSKVYGLLEPGPVVLLTTAWQGRRNVMPQSWHCMLDFEPPTLAMVVSAANFSFSLLEPSGLCALNIPTEELAAAVVGCGNSSGADTDKFAAFGLTPETVAPFPVPLIRECYASLACKVVDPAMVPRYGLFILEVTDAWVDPAVTAPRTLHHRGYGTFAIAERTLTLPSAMK